ncbi:MAG TPA: PilZ domain-containing protein [bacterium]
MPEANIFFEKRADQRISVKIPVKYRLVEELQGIQSILESKKTITNTESLDISLSGTYIVTEQKLDIGTILNIEISIQNTSRTIFSAAEVVWSKESGAGLRFILLKDDDLKALRVFIEETSTKK